MNSDLRYYLGKHTGLLYEDDVFNSDGSLELLHDTDYYLVLKVAINKYEIDPNTDIKKYILKSNGGSLIIQEPVWDALQISTMLSEALRKLRR